MSKEMWSQLNRFSDGDSLNADTLNVPIGQLGDRTSYLYARLKELLSGGKLSSVILTDVKLHVDEGDEINVGNIVYLHQLDNDTVPVASKARATMSLVDDFRAAESAFSVGVLQSYNGNTGNVIVYGNQNLNSGGSNFQISEMIEYGEEFRPGRYYLSSNEAGRLTANPNGPVIYVCSIWGAKNAAGGIDGRAMVSPQFLDIGTSHIHRTAVLTARPAGTYSTEGYLPIGDDSPLALRFGGTWTADRKITYRFYLTQQSTNWPGGVELCWKEDDGNQKSVTIHAPDEEVYISNGLTARLSITSSNPSTAYTGLSTDQITWEPLVFPDAGKGWLDHVASGVASSESVEGLKVAIRGKFGDAVNSLNVSFPGEIKIYDMPLIVDGICFVYRDKTYEFTEDTSSYVGSNTPLPLGTCLADSCLYLAQALQKDADSSSSPGETFAVYEHNPDSSSNSYDDERSWLMIMDGSRIGVIYPDSSSSSQPTDLPACETQSGAEFDVIDDTEGQSGALMVLSDRNQMVVGMFSYLRGVSPYTWVSDGDITIMVYQDISDVVTVPKGTVASATICDDEPDALYDYVIGMDQQIAKYWPPVPVKSAALLVNGVEMDNKALVPCNPTVSFSKDTIHWFEDDFGRKPWPEDLTGRDAYINPSDDKIEIMHWVRGFQGSTGPVTSLQVKDGSPLKIYGYGTYDHANTGDLEIGADFDFKVENGGAPGYNVPKRSINGKLIAGPVVERIIGGAGVSVISKAGCPDGQGSVIVALDNGAYRSHFTDIALENAEQAKIGMFPYIRLRGYSGSSITSPSAFTATMRVPTNLPDGKYALRLSASVFGEEGKTGSIYKACVKLSYNILPDFSAQGDMRYGNLKTSLLYPDADRTVEIPFGHDGPNGIVYNGFDPVYITTDDPDLEKESDVIEKVLGGNIPLGSEFAHKGIVPELRPGYLVGIRISRAITQSTDALPYTGAIGFINLSWTLVSSGWQSRSNPVSNPLAGEVLRTNTTAGIRSAVETIGEALGAEVERKTTRSSGSRR